jgi:hypothetical protein
MARDDVDAYEAALRRLPEAHSLALRLKSAGVADEVVCDYLHIEPEGMRSARMGHPGDGDRRFCRCGQDAAGP